jgi:hypothetical protein
MNIRALTKSVVTLPWAVSMFGVQQLTNLVGAPPSADRMSGAARAFDKVSDATADQLDGWLKQTYQVGNGVQRTLVDLMMLRPPALDSSALMRMAAEMQSGAMFQAVMKYGMPPASRARIRRLFRRNLPTSFTSSRWSRRSTISSG